MMRSASRSILVIVGLLLTGWGAWWFTRPSPAGGTAMRGQFAPLDTTLAGDWVAVATLSDDAIELGAVTGLDARGDTLALSHVHGASLVIGGVPRFVVGDATKGAPEFVERGEGIAIAPGAIVQIDQRARKLIYRNLRGERLRVRAIPVTGMQVHSLIGDGNAQLLVFQTSESGAPEWWIHRFDDTRTDTVFGPYAAGGLGGAYRTPMLAVTAAGYTVVDALDGRSYRLARDGSIRDSAARADAPRLALSEQQQQRVRDLAGVLPEATRRAVELGDFLPYAQRLGTTPDGRLLAISPDSGDASQVELLEADGRPVATLFAQRERWPLYPADGTIFRVRDAGSTYVIERLTFRQAVR